VHVEEVAPPAARTALGASGDAAIDALEASEDRGLKHYLDDVCKVDRDTRTLVAREILPEQVRIAARHLHPSLLPLQPLRFEPVAVAVGRLHICSAWEPSRLAPPPHP
jgi:hypothetical protein